MVVVEGPVTLEIVALLRDRVGHLGWRQGDAYVRGRLQVQERAFGCGAMKSAHSPPLSIVRTCLIAPIARFLNMEVLRLPLPMTFSTACSKPDMCSTKNVERWNDLRTMRWPVPVHVRSTRGNKKVEI